MRSHSDDTAHTTHKHKTHAQHKVNTSLCACVCFIHMYGQNHPKRSTISNWTVRMEDDELNHPTNQPANTLTDSFVHEVYTFHLGLECRYPVTGAGYTTETLCKANKANAHLAFSYVRPLKLSQRNIKIKTISYIERAQNVYIFTWNRNRFIKMKLLFICVYHFIALINHRSDKYVALSIALKSM